MPVLKVWNGSAYDEVDGSPGPTGPTGPTGATGPAGATGPSTPASSVVFTPTGNVAATNVQAAIAEVDSEKATTGHAHSGTYEAVGVAATADAAHVAAGDPHTGYTLESQITASGKGFVNHGSTAGTARPVGYASVEWYGSVTPSNAVTGDTWVDTT